MYHSPSASFNVYDQVIEDELPRRFFESRLLFFPLASVLSISCLYLQVKLGLYPSPLLSALAVITEVVSYSADVYFTQRLFRLKPLLDKAGYAFPVHEGGAFLPPFPSLKAELFSFNALINVALLPISYTIPSVAVASLTLRTQAALINRLMARRVRRTLEKLQSSEIE